MFPEPQEIIINHRFGHMNTTTLRMKSYSLLSFTFTITFVLSMFTVLGQTYTTSQTVVAPSSGSVIIQCWGAGGGGGGASNGSADAVGGGGGGGAFSQLTFPVTAGQNLVLTIGAGGAAGNNSGGNGGNGGATSVAAPFAVSANGGSRGLGATSGVGAGGAGGTGGTGFLYSGGAGKVGLIASTNKGGGGGSSAGTGSNGNVAGAQPAGGTAVAGGAAGGNGGNPGCSTCSAAGSPGGNYGGGGGGASVYGGSMAGGAGAGGKVILTWVACSAPGIASAISGLTNPCQGTSQVYSVTSAGATSFAWTFPPGWVITAGSGTSSVTVTVGVGAGTISVIPSNACASAAAQNLAVTICSVPVAATFTADGSWTVPPCVTSVTVEVWGAGGGGGGVASRVNSGSTGSEACSAGGGGGGGGYAIRNYTVTPGDVYAIKVGLGGTGGVGNSASSAAGNAQAGGYSSFAGPATAGPGALTGLGGAGGGGAMILNNATGSHLGTNGVGGAGASGTNGTVSFTGGTGATGKHDASCNDQSGGGGGGAGSGTNGGNATVLACWGSQTGGTGGSASGGIGGNGRQGSLCTSNCRDQLNGNNGTTIGAGGGGGLIHDHDWNNVWVTANGGNGARGEVRLTFNVCLPIELMEFTGTCEENERQFNWSTASETNNDYFVIEQSLDGESFTEAAKIQGAGNSTDIIYYGHKLDNANGDYFRLKQVDINGAHTNSDIIYVACDRNNEQSIFFPNPFNDELTIDLSSMNRNDLRIQVLDLNGKMVFEANTEHKEKSQSNINLHLSELKAGVYIIEVKSILTDELLKTERIIKL